MKNLALFIVLLLSSSSFAQSSADKIVGIWWSEDNKGRVKVYKSNNKYYGKIIWLKEPNDDNGKPLTDKENHKLSQLKLPCLKLVDFVS